MTSRHHETSLVSRWSLGDIVFTPLKHIVHTYLKSCFEHVEHLVCAPLLIMIARMYLGQPNRCVGVVWGRRSDVDSVWDHGVCSGPTFISFWQPRPEIPLSRPAGGCGETTTTNADESQKSKRDSRRALTRATTFLKLPTL